MQDRSKYVSENISNFRLSFAFFDASNFEKWPVGLDGIMIFYKIKLSRQGAKMAPQSIENEDQNWSKFASPKLDENMCYFDVSLPMKRIIYFWRGSICNLACVHCFSAVLCFVTADQCWTHCKRTTTVVHRLLHVFTVVIAFLFDAKRHQEISLHFLFLMSVFCGAQTSWFSFGCAQFLILCLFCSHPGVREVVVILRLGLGLFQNSCEHCFPLTLRVSFQLLFEWLFQMLGGSFSQKFLQIFLERAITTL